MKNNDKMTLQKLVTNYAAYNLWANQQYVNWLSTKSEEQLNQEVPSSFSSLLKTLNHIWAIEAYWFSLLTNDNDVENRYSVEVLKKEEIFEGLISRSTLLANAIAAFTEKELQESIEVVSPWYNGQLTRGEYVQHLINHGTYHRGQAVTIARNIGWTDIPSGDYIFFAAANQ